MESYFRIFCDHGRALVPVKFYGSPSKKDADFLTTGFNITPYAYVTSRVLRKLHSSSRRVIMIIINVSTIVNTIIFNGYFGGVRRSRRK